MDAYDHGYAARLRGCYRVLADPKDEQELREWQAGWDHADRESRQNELEMWGPNGRPQNVR